MKKLIAVAAVACLLAVPSLSASAASTKTVKVGNLITVTYPSSVKLKASGCQLIPVSYKVGSMGSIDFSYAGILDDEDSLLGGEMLYRTPEMAKSNGYKVSKKSGKINIKICRSDWAEDIGDGEYEDHVGATKGEFQFYVTTSKQDNVGYIKLY